jgi:CRP-like cAMP-binding protein
MSKQTGSGTRSVTQDLINDSSFGAIDVRDLRGRAPDDIVETIVGRVERRAGTVLREGGWTAGSVTSFIAELSANPAIGSVALAASPRRDSGPTADDSGWPANTLLGRLRDGARRDLMSLGAAVRYTAGREVIEQHAKDTHLLLLLDGVVKVQTTSATGDTALLEIRVAGDVVGEMAALDHKPRSATVVTCGDVAAKLITSRELMSFLHRRNDVFVEMIGMINERLRWADRRRSDFLASPIRERLARVLVELMQAYGRQEELGWTLGIPLTNVELASVAGIKPGTAQKAFGDLRKAGVVVSHLRRDVLVPDLDELRKFAGLDN